MSRWPRWRRLAALAGLGLGVALGHALAARALIDHGVAGALLAGGGGWGPLVGAAGFLLFRLTCFVAIGLLPAVVIWRLSRRP